jgi:TatD DNase family protein
MGKYVSELSAPAVVHCFTGTAEEAQKYVEMGFYLGWHCIQNESSFSSLIIGFTGVICNIERGRTLREILKSKAIPLDKLLIETDAPFMLPRNMPRADGKNVCRSTYLICQLFMIFA